MSTCDLETLNLVGAEAAIALQYCTQSRAEQAPSSLHDESSQEVWIDHLFTSRVYSQADNSDKYGRRTDYASDNSA